MSFTLTGIMYNRDQPVEKTCFHVYDITGSAFLARGKIGKRGSFSVSLSQRPQINQQVSLLFRLCKDHLLARQNEETCPLGNLVNDFDFLRERTEIGEVSVRFIPKDAASHYLGNVFLQKVYPQERALGHLFDVAKAGVLPKLIAAKERARENVDFLNLHDVKDVSRAFGITETIPLTTRNTTLMLLNGICPTFFKRISAFEISAEVNWDRYEFDKLASLPNVKAFFDYQASTLPTLTRVEVVFRKTLQVSSKPSDKLPVKTYKYLPAESKTVQTGELEEGLRIANSVFHLFGQAVFHLGIGHVYGAQVAGPAKDLLSGHRLGALLLPHCDYIRQISDQLGKTAIFGEDGALNASGLSVRGIAQVIADTLGGLDPLSFTPRRPMCPEHAFALAQEHHYKVLTVAVHHYFDAHWNEMVASWGPVHRFFKTLHKRSPEYLEWAGDKSSPWLDANEIGGSGATDLPARTDYKGDKRLRSIRPVAVSPVRPQGKDREQIEHFVVDFINRVTLWHSWIHRSQYVTTPSSPSVQDVNFAPISLENYGRGAYGGLTVDDAIRQLEIVKTFVNFDVSEYQLADKNNKVVKEIKDAVKTYADVYQQLGLPINQIQLSTVI